MTTYETQKLPDGTWRASIHPGHADELLGALDPQAPFVIIECGDPSRGWHHAPVAIGREREPQIRRVRNLGFDVLVNVADAIALGEQIRHAHVGGLTCYQFRNEPPADFHLPSEHGRASAMRGRRVHLTIQLPHDGEVAVISSAEEEAVRRFLTRATAR